MSLRPAYLETFCNLQHFKSFRTDGLVPSKDAFLYKIKLQLSAETSRKVFLACGSCSAVPVLSGGEQQAQRGSQEALRKHKILWVPLQPNAKAAGYTQCLTADTDSPETSALVVPGRREEVMI